MVRLAAPDGRGEPVVIPESAAPQFSGGGLTLETHARLFTYRTPEGNEQARALTVFLVNRRSVPHRFYADVSYAFQARIELVCPQGFRPRRDISGYWSDDFDMQTADLHYRDVCEYAVGRNSAAAWGADEEIAGHVTRVWTDPLPQAEVERVAPNEDESLKSRVVFGMEALAERAEASGASLRAALDDLPLLYAEWIGAERRKIADLAPRRRQTAERLINEMEVACKRVEAGIEILSSNDIARAAFRFMNLAVARAAWRRNARSIGDPAAQPAPEWRPFQLAFILLNIAGLSDRLHPDREIADLLFFPTGGGKTEAYLGLAAYVIVRRRLTGPGVLGAGVAVIMRYTLRLLTLDQLSRAAGVVCALELMRTDPN
ncbi:MAG: DISARM system helicase DrmA, partial [Pseudomonadota bacterium]